MGAVEDLTRYIAQRNPLQKKYFDKELSQMPSEDREDLEKTLSYFGEDHSISDMGDAYLIFLEDTLNETRYFVKSKWTRYRYSKFSEVNDSVYQNTEYMSKYMLGLQLSGYLWNNHRRIFGFFKEMLLKYTGGSNAYIEIGPGHGRYFTEAVNTGKFHDYYAIDLSQTSIDMTRRYLDRFSEKKNWSTILGDFNTYEFDCRFDFVCISEVLEHVEDPQSVMQKIYEVLASDGSVYVNVPINAPAIDHIFLFRSVDDVRELMNNTGFDIRDEIIVTGNDLSIEKAVKYHGSINYAFVAKKR